MEKPRILQQNKIETKVGQSPGYLFVPDNALPTRLFLISFNETEFEEKEYTDSRHLLQYIDENPQQRHWIDVRGYGSLPVLQHVARNFNIHPLQLEDVINDYQRPKVEEENGRLFIVSRMIAFSPDKCLDDDQLTLLTGPNYVISFQSDYEDCLEPLRKRIRAAKGAIRHRPALYIAYAIMDVVLDHYFPLMSEISDYLDNIEDLLFRTTNKQLLNRILAIKKEIVKLRGIIWSERDKITELLRAPAEIVPDELKIYFKDSYDHAVQLIDLAETYKETTANLTQLHLANVSNRMNEIMKVLTVISSIFIPLSFIVGLYGMNFSRENPNTGKINYLNMPELYHPYGYVILLAAMAVLVTVQLIFFYRKGWLTKF